MSQHPSQQCQSSKFIEKIRNEKDNRKKNNTWWWCMLDHEPTVTLIHRVISNIKTYPPSLRIIKTDCNSNGIKNKLISIKGQLVVGTTTQQVQIPWT